MALVAAALAAALVLAGCGGSGGSGGGGSDGEVRLGVGGQPLLVYLPTTLADRLGYYRDEGLNVRIEDLQGGSKALQALQGGSVDVVSGEVKVGLERFERSHPIAGLKGSDNIISIYTKRYGANPLIIQGAG